MSALWTPFEEALRSELLTMRIRYRHNGTQQIVELSEGFEGHTVADLVTALNGAICSEATLGEVANGGTGIAGINIDGCLYSPSTPLPAVALWEGSLLETATVSEPSAELVSDSRSAPALDSENQAERASGSHDDVSRLVLAITGGLQAGREIVQPMRRCWTIGRSSDCDVVIDDPAVSRRHARVRACRDERPMVTDLGSLNGTVVSGRAVDVPSLVPPGAVVRMGATRLEWRSTVDDAPTSARSCTGAKAGRVSFNRPPRRRPSTDPSSLSAPAQPPSRPRTEPLSWIGITLPMAAGLVLALVWNPFMVIFAALGPLLTVGTWLERRRRATKDHNRVCQDAVEQMERFVASLPMAHMAERRRRVSLIPDLAEIVRRASTPSVCCWERRFNDVDAMQLGIGTADVPWVPTLDIDDASPGDKAAVADKASDAVTGMGPLEDVPVAVSLTPGEVVGIVGPVAEARSVARSLVLQAAVLHGPADLSIVGLVPGQHVHNLRSDEVNPWDWMLWLPHTVDVSGRGALVAVDSKGMTEVVETVRGDGDTCRVQLLVIDGVEPLTGRSAPGRELLALDRTAGIVVVSDTHDLPSACTAIVEVVHRAGGLRLIDPGTHGALEQVFAWGMTEATAADAAARLARLDDPELGAADSDCPTAVALIDLIGGEITPEAVLRRWSGADVATRMAAPIGADGNGPVEVDLVEDGPHLLVGGTTGSGKSELLRTLVAGLAMSADPEHVAFVLIDYKGGAAFDRCADIPHVAGLVTDLDDRLAERALVCLEAELRYREKRLRAAGAENLAEFHAQSGVWAASDSGDPIPLLCQRDPLPRLVVVVDEFATLATELPEFLDSLVGIAQRGRSLGVHMVLATQRPAGVVTDDIRANTSCRICLRVTDRHDSNDVIGAPDAAAIPRRRPGRALARFGPGDLTAFQTALVTSVTPPTSTGLRVTAVGDRLCSDSRGRVTAVGDRLCSDSRGRVAHGLRRGIRDNRPEHTRSDLDRVVDAVRSAHARRGSLPPRSPWPAPLPLDVTTETLPETAGSGNGAAWLVDDPTRQRQFASTWHPDDGHLVVIGGPGSGTSTTLASAVLDLCRHRSPGEQHVYAIDFDGGLLTALDGLPHTGSVVRRGDAERRMRLLRFLDEEVSARRASDVGVMRVDDDTGVGGERSGSGTLGRAWPEIVLLIDDLAGLSRAHDPVRDLEPHQWLARIWSNGPSVGVRTAVSLRRAADLSPELAAGVGVVLVHATTDIGDGLRFGLRADTTQLNPGRALKADDGRELQVVRPPGGDFAAAVADVAAVYVGPQGAPAAAEGVGCARGSEQQDGVPATVGVLPAEIGVLPAVVLADQLPVSVAVDDRSIDIRFAMSDLTLEPVGFALHDGDHAMVLGPPRSGRSAVLATIGAAARRAGVAVVVVTDASSSDLALMLGVEPVPTAALGDEISLGGSCRRLLLTDDADRLKDTAAGALTQIAAGRSGRDHLVVAMAADRLRSAYGHWLAELRSCRTGVLFRPGPLDGDLLGVPLSPRLRLMQRPGYGLIVSNGTAVAGQVALVV